MTTYKSENCYDEVPYPSYPYSQTHPDHLATVATLLGLAPPKRPYRVLELGCAAGGNLIPMALTRPDCSFVGVDFSARQIEEGVRDVQALQLENISLRACSILDVDGSIGEFDYLLCHGVFSWVPTDVQEKILAICSSHLSRDGIAYISYNTQPGWRQRGAVRDMMRYHVGRQVEDSPQVRIDRARALLDFLVEATQSSDSSYGRMLREQQVLLQRHSDAYVFHEHLEQDNEPLWFLDFCFRLESHGLRYLGEADFSSMVASASWDPQIQQQLGELASNLLEKEQYTDFIRNRSFRQTLICHATESPNYEVRGERLSSLFAASSGKVTTQIPDDSEVESDTWRLTISEGDSLCTPLRSTQIAFEFLCQAWPERVAVETLVEVAYADKNSETSNRSALKANIELALLNAYVASSGRLVELSVSTLDSASDDRRASQPKVNVNVRLQSSSGKYIVNRRHDVGQ